MPTGTYEAGACRFDLEQHFYWAELEGVYKWTKGAAPFVSMRKGASFDGATYREWHRSQHGTELPPLTDGPNRRPRLHLLPLIARISETESGSRCFPGLAHASGLLFFPPFGTDFVKAPKPDRLPELLTEKAAARQRILITERDDGSWLIEVPHPDAQGIVRLVVNPTRGGAITEAEWLNGTPVRAWRKLFITLAKWDERIWGPAELVNFNLIDRIGDRTTISNVRLDTRLSADDYRVAIPTGALVDDYVSKLTYTVSAGPVNEAQAVKNFIQRHEFKPIPPPALEAAGRGHVLLIAANVIILIVFSGFILSRRRGRGGTPVLVAALVIGQDLFAQQTARADPILREDWIVSYAAGEELKITQCGYNVAVLALEMNRVYVSNGRFQQRPIEAGVARCGGKLKLPEFC